MKEKIEADNEILEKIYEQIKITNEYIKDNLYIKNHKYFDKKTDNTVDNNVNDRILEISKIQGLNEYERLILRNLESRITILEEEAEIYNIN